MSRQGCDEYKQLKDAFSSGILYSIKLFTHLLSDIFILKYVLNTSGDVSSYLLEP